LRQYHYRLLDRADLERSVHMNLGVRGNADAGYGEGLEALLWSPPLRTYRRGRRKGIRADRGGLSFTGLTSAGADNSHPRLRHRSACLVGDGTGAGNGRACRLKEGRARTSDLSGCSTATDMTNAVIEKLARPYHTPGTSR
jgi:hypothetical protein